MGSSKKIKILICDDHAIIRDGIKSILVKNDMVIVAAEAENGKEALELLKKHKFDLILMDIQMPIMNGIDTTKKIMELYPGQRLLALTMNKERGYITKMLQAGASGYILKDMDKEELVNAIISVANGESYFSKKVSGIMMNYYMPQKSGEPKEEEFQVIDPEDLTIREREVLKLIVEECTNSEIGEQLYISTRTVDTHRRNLLQKLGVKNTAGLVKYAIVNNILAAG